ncbi:RNA polymerase sigma-70 factor [Nonomuraea sp. NPDC059194]|uniref:RNA polymerase sigma-70 factor n=1 Tax=Nonomuraea sp. NPDC059194 TaxID=3346764 RepID=UPI00367E4FD0
MSTEIFQEHRGLLTGVAYRILGSVADAEDVVQEAWLRWAGVDHATVEDAKAYLIRVTSRLAVDRLRWARSRRESYVGPWLPEPIGTTPDAAERAELTDTVELALLVVMETLSPLERAVFVLREAFDLPFAEIAEVVGRSEAATRQLARRARDHVSDRRPRFDTDRARRRDITERFVSASTSGDLDGLIALLSQDVTLVGDGGGRARSPFRVLAGREKVSRFLTAVTTAEEMGKFMVSAGVEERAHLEIAVTELNGAPGVMFVAAGRVVAAVSLVISDGKVDTVYVMVNPDKLGHLTA